MMNLIIGYLLIGVIFAIVVTVANMIMYVKCPDAERLGVTHLLAVVLMWPIDLVWFIQGTIAAYKIEREFKSGK